MDSKLKRLFIIPFLILLCAAQRGEQGILTQTAAGAGGTWTLHQFKNWDSNSQGTGGSACTGLSTCTVTTVAPTAGDIVLVVATMAAASSKTLSTPTMTGQTFTHCTNGGGSATTEGWFDCWYTLSAAASGTSVVCPASAATLYMNCAVYDYHWSGSSITADNQAAVTTDTSCTTCAGVGLTVAGTDVAVQMSIGANNITAISDATYANPANFTDGVGSCGKLNASGTLTTPNWTQSSAGAATNFGLTFQGH